MANIFQQYIDTLKLALSPEIYQLNFSKLIFSAIAIVSAVIILALFIATAVLSKRQRVIGIIAGAVNFACALLIPLFLRLWHNLKIGVYTFNSQAEATEFIIKNLLASLGTLAILGVVMAAFVLTLIYVITSFKNKPAIFSVAALVILIVRQIYIAPFTAAFPMLYKLFVKNWNPSVLMYSQAFQLILFFGSLMLVLALVLIPVIIKKAKGEKALKAAEASEEAPAIEEAPAAEEAAE